ncbi:hypothetical protein [Microbacterium sp. gxy059]|uniref:hypothetical protein n=1 Tax=Microbacterium sp. gxy059 TaxID=2957199 RepID=UPI003D988B8E
METAFIVIDRQRNRLGITRAQKGKPGLLVWEDGEVAENDSAADALVSVRPNSLELLRLVYPARIDQAESDSEAAFDVLLAAISSPAREPMAQKRIADALTQRAGVPAKKSAPILENALPLAEASPDVEIRAKKSTRVFSLAPGKSPVLRAPGWSERYERLVRILTDREADKPDEGAPTQDSERDAKAQRGTLPPAQISSPDRSTPESKKSTAKASRAKVGDAAHLDDAPVNPQTPRIEPTLVERVERAFEDPSSLAPKERTSLNAEVTARLREDPPLQTLPLLRYALGKATVKLRETAIRVLRSIVADDDAPGLLTALDEVRALVGSLPWSPERVALLGSLVRPPIADALDAAWLEGLGIEEILDLEQAGIERLTGAPAWRDEISSRCASALDDATQRRRVFRLLASPAVTAFAPEEAGRRAFAHVHAHDAQLRTWVHGLAPQAEEPAAQEEPTPAAPSDDDAEKQIAAQSEIIAQLTERLSATASELADLQSTAAQVRGSALAQASRDAYRALARVLATLDELAGQVSADQLVGRARQLAARSGVLPVGESGETVAFDPALHEAPGDRPDDGDPVFVGRPGYVWTQDGDTAVLVKTLVSKG